MVVFGGIYEITKELNDLHLFDFTKKRWVTLFEESYSPVRGLSPSAGFGNGYDQTVHHGGMSTNQGSPGTLTN